MAEENRGRRLGSSLQQQPPQPTQGDTEICEEVVWALHGDLESVDDEDDLYLESVEDDDDRFGADGDPEDEG